RRVTGFDQRLKAGADQLNQAAAENRLLTEEVGLALFLEGRLDNAGATAADGGGVGKRDVKRIARGVLMDRNEAGHAAATEIFTADRVAGALRRDHENVHIGARHDKVEVDVEAMREDKRRAFLHVRRELLFIDVR